MVGGAGGVAHATEQCACAKQLTFEPNHNPACPRRERRKRFVNILSDVNKVGKGMYSIYCLCECWLYRHPVSERKRAAYSKEPFGDFEHS